MRECPFCGSIATSVTTVYHRISGSAHHAVCCKACLAQGPMMSNAELAEKAWNSSEYTEDVGEAKCSMCGGLYGEEEMTLSRDGKKYCPQCVREIIQKFDVDKYEDGK